MSLLSNAILSSITRGGIGFFEYDTIPHDVKFALKAVTKRQRRKFKQYGIVPVPVLEAFWHLGLLPGKEAPQKGMKISSLSEYLKQGNFQNQASLDKGRWLYEKIIKDELIGPVTKRYRRPPNPYA